MEPTTSAASAPSAWPIWVPNMAPPIERITPISGPAMACISSGRTPPMALPTRSATGSTRSFQTGRVASIHSARLQATAVPAAGGELGAGVQPEVGEPDRLGDGRAFGGAHRAVLALALRGLGDHRLAGDVLGELPVHRPAVEGQHLAELLEGRAQVVGVEAAEHGAEGVVRAGRAAGRAHAEERPQRVARAETEGHLRGGARVGPALLGVLGLVALGLAVLGLLGRNAESEGEVAHGFLDLVGRHADGVAGKSAGPGRWKESELTAGERLPHGLARAGCTAGPSPRAGWTVRDTRTYAHKLTVEDGR